VASSGWTLDDYLPPTHEPHAEPMRATFIDAATELLAPFPSTPVLDFPMLNQIIGGFRPNEFSILCGATGTGKTTLIANWSASWLKQGVPHFVASVETGRTDFVKRVMSAMVDEDWNTGEAVPLAKVRAFSRDYDELLKAESLHLSRYENRFSVETLMADIAWHIKHKKIKIALIDNLNFFMEVRRAQDAVIEMDRVVHELVIFSKNVPIHIVMIMHPKKTETVRVESEFDIKGSSTAVQEAYNIFLFNRADPKLVEQGQLDKFDREVKIAKLRRRGRANGVRLILSTQNGVKYNEAKLL
jgi:replicative DNA helicase